MAGEDFAAADQVKVLEELRQLKARYCRFLDTKAVESHFDLNMVVAGDDSEHVAIVYETTATSDGGKTNIAGIEVFHVVPAGSPRSGTAATSKGFGIDQRRSHA